MMQIVDYSGYKCVALENDSLRLLVTQSVGPRILSFGLKDGDNLLAVLPAFVTELPQGGVFHFHGGHRLWVAPESFETTYIPDDSPVEITPLEKGLRVVQPVEEQTGLQKSLEILFTDTMRVVVTHKITNHHSQPVPCAPWAITQFKTGGVAILPQARQATGMLPNRSMALWSYTDMSNPNVTWGKEYILVSARMDAPFKVGFPNPRGWLAYWLNGILFVKHARYDENAQYYDFGSSSECYCNNQFLELETLGPMVTLQSAESTTHIEMWDVYKNIDRPQNENEAQAHVKRLGLK